MSNNDSGRLTIRAEIHRCFAEIRKVCPQSRVIVFGSAVDETIENPHDIDLLVIVPRNEDFKVIRRRILGIPRNSWPLDIIVVPDDFFAKKVAETGNFYAFVSDEGVEIDTKKNLSA